jgi:hypothetical protein
MLHATFPLKSGAGNSLIYVVRRQVVLWRLAGAAAERAPVGDISQRSPQEV